MDSALDQEIEQCCMRKALIEKKLLNNFSIDSLKLHAELLEVNIRLRLLYAERDTSEDETDQSTESENHDQVGDGRRRRKVVKGVESETGKTISEWAWLKEIDKLEKRGETLKNAKFEGKPLSHFFKFSNPVEKGSSSRGTMIFETDALITNVEDAKDPENLLKIVFKNLFKTAFSSKARPPDKLNVQFYGEGMGQPYYIPMRGPEQNNVEAIVAQFSLLSTSETLTSIFNNKLAVKVCGYWAPGGAACNHENCTHTVSCGKVVDNYCLARAICYGKKFLENKGKGMASYQINGLQRDTLNLMQASNLNLKKDYYTISDAEKLLDILGPEYRLVIYNTEKELIMNTSFAKNVIILRLDDNHFDYIPKLHLFLKMRKVCIQCLKPIYPNHHFRGCPKLCFSCMEANFDTPYPKSIKYVYFDIECQIIQGKHVPILLCSYSYCSICQDNRVDVDSPLSEAPKGCVCGVKSRYRSFNGYTGDSPVDKFLKYAFSLAQDRHKPGKMIILAHNLSKYDGHLLLEKLYEKSNAVNVVAQGFKLYTIDVKIGENIISFKDSLNFFASPLKALPKMFGFQEEASKKYFPHAFNLPENMYTKLYSLPPAHTYWPDLMKPEDRADFFKWYDASKSTPFCLTTDMEDYCKMDVICLMKSCVKFREIMLEINDIDPFVNSSTIASYAYSVFRANVLKDKMLVNVPDGGYRKQEKQSEEAIKFLRLYEMEHNVHIEDASNKGEFKIPGSNFKVDGIIRNKAGNVLKCLEYNSCYYHGHTCYDRNQVLANGVTAEVLYENTMERYNFIKKKYNIEMYWSCDFKKRLDKHPALKRLFKSIKVAPRIQLRETALKGGRVECFRLYYKCKEGEEIRFIDIVSLYPWVMKHCSFPLGHPRVFTWECFREQVWSKSSDNPYKGFILCTILPPRRLEPALLPYKSENGNLVFCLCRTCSDEENPVCSHSADERSWTATFTHAELNEALDLGYKATTIYEVWDYPEWSVPGVGPKDLFGKYVNTFLALKVEASGYPTEDPKEREEYIKMYKEKEGLILDPSKMEFNPGKRSVAKLMSNSLWGKLAQRSDLSEIVITKTAAEFHKVMADNTHEVMDFVHINDQTDRLVIKKKPEFQKPGKTTCLPVACFVTSHARLKLYSYLVKASAKRRLYSDTDSMGYILRRGSVPITEGIFLGEMSREYSDCVIIEIVIAGML
uniref:DNA-directed DNA polymerase n=1 Tax=Panagrolaimus sp. PS1159 TaxID=55785 RepID=A0AC35EU71_9BILA